ncbi:threonine--tRNA ligase [Candidatus Arthromitus sp. SFB-turkey]|uniref:threonine--tRNA ligase n=1 Tax=Candidatus Arthromitus sp. SFB-turkey TaxID=1840217 RepID=UPI0007F37E4F|nr:threonine--tRNA ligase [Candidatus Arthromitus sp. SFB-turkey]OAT88008.1 threonine--tRNA ligase [Candidatus Arthromitus sp. SFB-turkey]
MIEITLKDGSKKEIYESITVLDFAKSISEGLARNATCAEVDGEIVDLRHVIDKNCTVNILTFNDNDGKKAFWHTSSHILAQAVKRLFPSVKLAIGPSIENGFYYDFDIETPFSQDDLKNIEEEIKKICKEGLEIEKFVLSRDEAIKLMEERGETYKVELINDIPYGCEISFYKQGEFEDLCAGPHLFNTKNIKAIKLLSATGAYWRGNENNKMLTRVYGISFPKASMLNEYLEMLEEAKKRDHNKIGRELEFFTTNEFIGQGLPLLMPKGAKLMQILQRFVEDEEEKRGYVLTRTPTFAKSDLYRISGHWDHYRDGMFILGDEEKDSEVFALRPMTCPFQFMIYKATQKSYRDLPIRYGETAILSRNEASGEMHGLIRVRQFTLSDGHIICTPEQLEDEFKNSLDLVKYIMECIGINEDVTYRFSKWDKNNKEKYIGEEELWEQTQSNMKQILDKLEVNYVEADGEAAFYGPKLDIQFKNVHGKEDTIITIQIDFSLAERFDMVYIDSDGKKKHPMIIHRSSIGCYERTIAMLIEKYTGALPVWLSPVQVRVLPISDKFNNYGEKVTNELKKLGIRAECDYRYEKIGYKIRQGQLEKIPYLLIVGEKEESNLEVSVRDRKDGDKGSMNLDLFISLITEKIQNKK